MKYWLGDKNFPQQKLFPDEIFSHKVYLKFWQFWINSVPWQNGAPTSFSAVTPTNVWLDPKIFWLIVSTFLRHLHKISKRYLEPVPNYWTWTKSTSQNIWFFLWNPYKIQVMITSVIKMLQLPNFGHMATSTI